MADWKFGLKRQGRCTCEITYRCSHHRDSIGVANNSETCNAAMPPLGVQPEERESVSQTSAPHVHVALLIRHGNEVSWVDE